MSRRSMIPIAVGVLTAGCFLPTLSGSFLNWDDNVNFLDNPAYRGLGVEQLRWAFTSVLFGHYIPLTRLSWSLNYVLGGMDPWGYHLVNVLLHGINAATFYFVARRLLAAAGGTGGQPGRREPALCAAATVAALVFGAHPLRVEPVAWISGRTDLLCATFALLAVWAYLRAVEEGDGRARPGPVLVSAAAFAAALLSKGGVLLLPAALILLDVYPLRRLAQLGWRPLLREKIPLLLVMLVGAVVIVRALREGAVLTHPSEYGAVARVSVLAHSFLVSVARFIWPAALSPLYEMPARVSVLEPRFGLVLGATVLITAVLILARRRWPGGLAAWTFSALMLAPMSMAVRMGADLAPDRYTYLSGLGFATLAGGAALTVIQLVRRGAIAPWRGWAAALAALVAIAGLGATSWSFGQVWTQSETLWRWAVELDPDCSVCHGKLGESALGGPGGTARVVEAEGLFRRAIALRPDLPDAYFNLGTALVVQGRHAEARAPFLSYTERVPVGPDAPGLRSRLVQALRGHARELQARGRNAEADALLAEARALESAPPAGR
jgi:hypothetical protein